MRKSTAILVIGLSVLSCSMCSAQCSRGSRSSNSAGGFSSSLAFSSQQTPQVAMQQHMLRQLAARQLTLSQRRAAGNVYNPGSTASRRSTSQKDRLRLQNAEKALASAQKAELLGRLTPAERSYKKVLRILGPRHPISQVATEGLAGIQSRHNDPVSETNLVELLASLDR